MMKVNEAVILCLPRYLGLPSGKHLSMCLNPLLFRAAHKRLLKVKHNSLTQEPLNTTLIKAFFFFLLNLSCHEPTNELLSLYFNITSVFFEIKRENANRK